MVYISEWSIRICTSFMYFSGACCNLIQRAFTRIAAFSMGICVSLICRLISLEVKVSVNEVLITSFITIVLDRSIMVNISPHLSITLCTFFAKNFISDQVMGSLSSLYCRVPASLSAHILTTYSFLSSRIGTHAWVSSDVSSSFCHSLVSRSRYLFW